MDTPETLAPFVCALCAGQLPRLENGQQFWTVRDGERIHVPPCPPLVLRVGELTDDDGA